MYVSFVCKSFIELSCEELYRILQLRCEVFVVEQNCAYQDMDNKDKVAQHLMMYAHDELAGYARLLPEGISYDCISIGRVVNPKDYRKKGLGKLLMEKAVIECYRLFGKESIQISAQVYAIPFYQKIGFEPLGDIYPEDGIPHIQMILKPQ